MPINQKISIPRGTADILPSEVGKWRAVEIQARAVLNSYNYKEIRTPIFEDIGLFKRSLGQTSDVVNKQLLELRSGKEDEDGFALRPEGTASIVRSYIENDLHKKESISKFFYIAPMFRGERPQKGRLRQFHQIGAEAIGPGTLNPFLDAEMIALSANLLESFGLSGYRIKINNLGTPEDKGNFSVYLRTNLKNFVSSLCEDCQNRFERNVFRILDCKNKQCMDIVNGLKLDNSFLSEGSRKYFDQVKSTLDSLKIPYVESFKLVRGLDYYNYTVFEITHSGLGSQDAIGAGGRYNNLVAELGGGEKDITIGAIGFSLGFERILLALGETQTKEEGLDVFVAALDEKSFQKGFELLQELRKANLSADIDYKMASLKSQMRMADKYGANFVLILGENEIQKGIITVKDMKKSSQEEMSLKDTAKLIHFLKSIIH